MGKDDASRKRIVKELDRNFFVEASAGSGKTTSLVYRMVALIESGVPVEKICTITFTKAAANEFFERFQSLLSIRSGDTPDRSDKQMKPRTKESKKLCEEALANIDLCFLGTIDSFCNMIAHEMPTELNIPSSSSVISKEEYSRIVKEEYYKILRNVDHPLHGLAKQFNNFISNKTFDAFVAGISLVNDLRNLEIVFDSAICDGVFDNYITAAEKANFLEMIGAFVDTPADQLYNLSDAGPTNKKRINGKEELAIKYRLLKEDINNWCEHISDLNFAFKNINDMNGFIDDAENTNVQSYIWKKTPGSAYSYSPAFEEDVKNLKSKINRYKYSLYFKFILSVLDEVTASLKEKGKFQFFDFQLYLRDAFRDSALSDRVLIDHIYERHSYFLLDESQDTNPIQTELFFYLTSTKVDKDWRKMEPIEKSLFIVGDPKQSIYGFRGADVKAYLENKKIFESKGELLELTSNFRSHAHLKEWFNDSFDEMLNYKDSLSLEFALRHNDIPIEPDDATKTISLDDSSIIEGPYRYRVHGYSAKGNPATDCDSVAKLIVDLMRNRQIVRTKYNPSTKNFDLKNDDIKYSDFLVVPFGTDMSGLITAFNKYNIPMIVEGKMPFENAQSFGAVLDHLFLLKNPGNTVLFTRLMTSDLYAFNDSDIIQMLNDGFDLDISNPSLDEIKFSNAKSKEIVDILHSTYLETMTLSFSSTMLYILNNKELNIFSRISAKDMEYICYLIEKVREGEETGTISTFEQLQNYVELFISKGDEQRTVRFSDEIDRVKIANLHKVKGLQAPIVILAKPNKGYKEVKSYINYSDNPPSVKFSKVEDSNSYQNYVETDQFVDELPKWEAAANAEKDRLAYVGATRAEAALIVTENDSPSSAGHWAKLVDKISSSRTLPVPDINEISPEYEDVSLGDYRINEESHKQSFNYVSPSQSRHNGFNTNKDEIDDANFDEGTADREKATMEGTMVHKLMECIVSSKNTYNVDELIKTILSDYGYSKEYDVMLHNIAFKILNGGFQQINSSLDKDILKTLLEAKKVWCEVPFSYQSKEGNIVSGIIDCMYLDKNNKYHIIDYKTNKENDVSELEKHYGGKLKNYYCALKKMGIEADAHIYHIDLDK